MNQAIYLFIPLIFFGWYIVTLRVLVYWRMLKRKTAFDYFIVICYYTFSVIHFPIKLSENFPDRKVLALSRRYDKLLMYFYFSMTAVLACIVLLMIAEMKERSK
jgi:hypothetical protein